MTTSSSSRYANFVRQLKADRHLRDVGFVSLGKNEGQILQRPHPGCWTNSWVVLEMGDLKPDLRAQSIYHSTPERESKLLRELLLLGLNCTGAALAGVVAAGAGAATPFTAGTSTVVATIAATGAWASALQCGYSIGRVTNEVFMPENNDWLDSQQWVQTTAAVIDSIGLLSSAVSLGQTTRTLLNISRSSSRSLIDVLQRMSRAERKQLAQELAKSSGVATTRREFLLAARAGKTVKVVPQHAVDMRLREIVLESFNGGLSGISSWLDGAIQEVRIYVAATRQN